MCCSGPCTSVPKPHFRYGVVLLIRLRGKGSGHCTNTVHLRFPPGHMAGCFGGPAGTMPAAKTSSNRRAASSQGRRHQVQRYSSRISQIYQASAPCLHWGLRITNLCLKLATNPPSSSGSTHPRLVAGSGSGLC